MSHDQDRRAQDRFRVRPRPPAKDRRQPGSRFVVRVLNASKSTLQGGGPAVVIKTKRRPKRGRGQVMARLGNWSLGVKSRRVVVKCHLVVLKQAGARNLTLHLRYIAREGVAREAAAGIAYGPHSNASDLVAFQKRCQHDRHYFRFIVAPEDAAQIQDLTAFTRALMERVQSDLGTRLDWVAVDHWDTENPHTHLVLRGRTTSGEDLVIDPSYIAYGMRRRAIELATEWLGERTEFEIRKALASQVHHSRWTSLDQHLAALTRDGIVDLAMAPRDSAAGPNRSLLNGRLAFLETIGLATRQDGDRWTLRADTEMALRTLGERADIIRTMQRALGNERREMSICDGQTVESRVVGQIAAKGLADELTDRAYLIVDGIDGNVHYIPLPAGADLANWPVGGVVEATAARERRADRAIQRMAADGVYRPNQHLARLKALPGLQQADEIVDGYVRRLEALRRAGIVERLTSDCWQIPADFVTRATAYDRKRLGGWSVELQTHLPVAEQVGAFAETWLDRQLAGQVKVELGFAGFGHEVRDALKARVTVLCDRGFDSRDPATPTRLRDLEITKAAGNLSRETGLPYRPTADGTAISGTYRRSVQLISGRFALLDDGLGFTLVPWRPVLESRRGQTLTAMVRGGTTTYEFGRGLGR